MGCYKARIAGSQGRLSASVYFIASVYYWENSNHGWRKFINPA
ncbi:hypothetical protein VHA_001374 [Grimontia hollisae CIP 101886]|uniref:Uncharacterized protein n=1 Tax=Grimontia hollisae CIP 101886 TaxID=675812 RepID=D0I6K7_GRIHO|nr:hypothetical protein VHA_001374 [Grimontia hollisae CIP 101886]